VESSKLKGETIIFNCVDCRQDQLDKEMTLDLHGFHVDEAIGVLKQVIQEKEHGEIPLMYTLSSPCCLF
jgi:hypothetical protein